MPVLAIGSNRSPSQLIKKFGTKDTLPVQRVWCRGYDVVFGARVSSYGAIPATLFPSPQVRCEVAITWLTETQLLVMDRSEGVGRGYRRITLSKSSIETVGRPMVGDLSAYVTESGALPVNGEPMSLSAVRATGRTFRAGCSTDAVRTVRALICPGAPVAVVTRRLRLDDTFRKLVRGHLREVGVMANFSQ